MTDSQSAFQWHHSRLERLWTPARWHEAQSIGRGPRPADQDTEEFRIDWEWIAVGPPALDVARVCGSAAAVCDPSQPHPEALFSGELPEYYFERYRAHGGALADGHAWRRSFELAFLACALTQAPFAGSMIRHGVRSVVATFERQVEMMLPAARSLRAL